MREAVESRQATRRLEVDPGCFRLGLWSSEGLGSSTLYSHPQYPDVRLSTCRLVSLRVKLLDLWDVLVVVIVF